MKISLCRTAVNKAKDDRIVTSEVSTLMASSLTMWISSILRKHSTSVDNSGGLFHCNFCKVIGFNFAVFSGNIIKDDGGTHN